MSERSASSKLRVSRNVKVLGAVSLAQDTGSEMLYPLLPKFITATLGAPVIAVGVAEGLADAVSAAMKLAAGRFARRRRRRWIAAGYATATIGKVVVATAVAWPAVIVGRVIDRTGKGIRGVPRDALVADDTPQGARGRAFGLHRSLDTLGAVIGPILGLVLLHALNGNIRATLALAVIPAAISVALVALVREPPGSVPPQPRLTGEVTEAQIPPQVRRLLYPLVVFAFVNSTDALLIQHAGDVGLSTSEVVVAYVGFNIVYAVLGYPAGRLADRVPHVLVFAGGLATFSVAYIGLGLLSSAAAVWILFPIYGAFPALTDGVGRAWIADLCSPDTRTWALGVHAATTGLATLGAGVWSGLLWGRQGRLPLTISGTVAALIAGWLLLTNRPDASARPEPTR